MELEKFKRAEKIKENLDRWERQKRKLELALESCSLSVTIEFNPSKTFLTRKDDVSINNREIIREMILKEIKDVETLIMELKKQFSEV